MKVQGFLQVIKWVKMQFLNVWVLKKVGGARGVSYGVNQGNESFVGPTRRYPKTLQRILQHIKKYLFKLDQTGTGTGNNWFYRFPSRYLSWTLYLPVRTRTRWNGMIPVKDRDGTSQLPVSPTFIANLSQLFILCLHCYFIC